MFEVLAFHLLPQCFPCRVFAVVRPMRHSRRRDTSSGIFAPGAVRHVISITPGSIRADFSQEELKRWNSVTTKLTSFSTQRCLETSGADVKAH
jgi:hypothetical protein